VTQSNQFTVTNGAAVKVVSAAPQYQQVNLHGTQPVYVGAVGVTSSTGYLLDKDLNLQFTIEPYTDYYAIASSVLNATLYTLVTVL